MDHTKKRQRQQGCHSMYVVADIDALFPRESFSCSRGTIRAYPITNRGTPVTILLKIVPSVSLRSLRLSRQGFLYTIIFRLADLSGILSPGKQMSSSLFSRISSVHPLCVCHNSLEGFACHHCDCVQGLFMSRLNRL